MICCPFHADRNPSMKVDFRFHCFGCGADGDVIDFTAKLFQLSLRQAAEKLASDFGLSATGTFHGYAINLWKSHQIPKSNSTKSCAAIVPCCYTGAQLMLPGIQKIPCILASSQACTTQTVCSICWTFFCREARMKNNNYSTERK